MREHVSREWETGNGIIVAHSTQTKEGPVTGKCLLSFYCHVIKKLYSSGVNENTRNWSHFARI